MERKLTLSAAAREELDAYFAGREPLFLRIYAASGGCSGRRLALAPGEPGNNDTVFEASGYVFRIDNKLLDLAGDLVIDLSHNGFSVNAGRPLDAGACGPCSGCSGSGSSRG